MPVKSNAPNARLRTAGSSAACGTGCSDFNVLKLNSRGPHEPPDDVMHAQMMAGVEHAPQALCIRHDLQPRTTNDKYNHPFQRSLYSRLLLDIFYIGE